MIVQVLTVNGQPEFEFYARDASEIDAEVEQRHTRQASGTPHNWRGLTSGCSRPLTSTQIEMDLEDRGG